jgi:DNA-binding response OmpR family regulator
VGQSALEQTVLVVEDDCDIRALVIWKLATAGFATLEAPDGEAGLAAAATGLPDLILLDWTLPKMSGLDVCVALRARLDTARIPIVLLTANAREADLEQGIAAGADDYLVKPFSPRELISRVEAVLAAGRRRR